MSFYKCKTTVTCNYQKAFMKNFLFIFQEVSVIHLEAHVEAERIGSNFMICKIVASNDLHLKQAQRYS
jgi:hypothetical protein